MKKWFVHLPYSKNITGLIPAHPEWIWHVVPVCMCFLQALKFPPIVQTCGLG